MCKSEKNKNKKERCQGKKKRKETIESNMKENMHKKSCEEDNK